MALIECPNCGRKISGLASSCPFCDHPLRSQTEKTENNPYYNEEGDFFAPRKATSRNQKVNTSDGDTSTESDSVSSNQGYGSIPIKDPVQEETKVPRYKITSSPDEKPVHYQQLSLKNRTQPFSKKPTSSAKSEKLSPEETIPAAQTEELSASNHGISYSYHIRYGSAGRRLLGFRHGEPYRMFLMLFYYLGAAVLVLYGFKSVPLYKERGLQLMQVIRTMIGALLLYLPALLLSYTGLRERLPLLRDRSIIKARIAVIAAYIPILILFILVCLKFRA